MLPSQILVLQFFLTKQDLEHKGQTQTKPQCETQLKTKRNKMPNEKYQSVILKLLHVWGERAELTFEVKSTFFSMQSTDLAIFFKTRGKAVCVLRQNCFRDNYLS